MTKLAVAILVETVENALGRAALAAERGADLVEFRLDRFSDPPQGLAELVRRSPLPCIVTCRPAWEGGEYEGQESDRLAVLERAAEGCPAYIDLELAAGDRSAEGRARIEKLVRGPGAGGASRPGLILSSHDFRQRPPDLTRRIQAMAQDPRCDVVKAAWRARSLRDNLEAFELLRHRPKPMIALCMGEFGLPSRVLARKYGAMLTFAGLDDETVTAPGQAGVETMKRLYRWDAIGPGTRVYGVIGWPVGHSLSPHLHNAGFGAVGHDGVYLPMPIPPEYEHFKATVGSWIDDAHLDFRGASVTIPHKQNLLRFVEERGGKIEPLARRIGAANTLSVGEDGALHASNTDYAAAVDAVCDALGVERAGLAGRRVAVIGAGGAARAIVAAFVEHGATVVVYNRTAEKAQELAAQFGGGPGKAVAAPLDDVPKTCCGIVVNCTPIGMHPQTDATPVPRWPEALGRGGLVFDTIYNPPQTRLLREAAEHGCVTVSGIEMFVRQAAGQFTLWTGRPAPVELLRQVLQERLR